jgi:hypothetical protein
MLCRKKIFNVLKNKEVKSNTILVYNLQMREYIGKKTSLWPLFGSCLPLQQICEQRGDRMRTVSPVPAGGRHRNDKIRRTASGMNEMFRMPDPS